jgi:hypothetical protein
MVVESGTSAVRAAVRISTVLSFFHSPVFVWVRRVPASSTGSARPRLGACVPGWESASPAGCARLRLGGRYQLVGPLAAVAGCASHLDSSPPQSPAARPAARPPLLQHTLTSSPSLHAHAPPTPTLDAHDVVCRAAGLERRLYTRTVSARTLPWHRQRAATREPRDTPSMSDPECLSALRASGEAAQSVQGTHAQPRPAPGAGSSRR